MLSYGSDNTLTHTSHNTLINIDTLMFQDGKLGLKERYISGCLRNLMFSRHQCSFHKLGGDLSLEKPSGLDVLDVTVVSSLAKQ